jgi:excisionase family DNA binding protein
VLNAIPETIDYGCIIDSLMAAADTSSPQKFLYTRHETAKAIGVSLRSVDHLLANKQLAFRRVGKKVLIPTAELARFARADHRFLTQTPDND